MVVGAGLSYSGQWRGGCWRRGIPSVHGGGIGGEAPVVIVIGHHGKFKVGLLDIGEGPAFVRVESGSGGRANWKRWGRVFRDIPREICV